MTIMTLNDLDRVFQKANFQKRTLAVNPITGGLFMPGLDPIGHQKKLARRMLAARKWFFLHGPKDAPPLPLSPCEQAELKYRDPLGHLVVDFACSLESNGWDVNGHPSFEDFARGVLASDYAPKFTRLNEALRKRYPPRQLQYITPGVTWRPVPARKQACGMRRSN
jgi:hypothetical protein